MIFPKNVGASPFRLKHRWDVSLAIQQRELSQEGYSELKSQTDAFFLIGLDQSIKNQDWVFEVRPELRALSSPSLETRSNDISRTALIDSSRAMDLHTQLSPAKDERGKFQSVADIERLNLRYQGSAFEMILGRNPFNPSIMRLSPVWNKFSRDIFSQSYPNLQFNPDMTSIKFTRGDFWIQNGNVLGRTQNQSAYLVLAGINFESVEVQALAGTLFDQPAFGANLNLSVSDSLVKIEWLTVNGREDSRTKHNEVAVGFERSWTESFSTTTELFYIDLANEFSDPTDITLGQSRFSGLRSKYYLLYQLEYQLNQTWQLVFTPVVNMSDSSFVLAGSLRWNIHDNLDATLTGRMGMGSERTEFSPRSIEFSDGSYVGYNNAASLMLKYFF